jgi:uncharacterized protein YndB with AHSA1/START domain
MGVRRRKAAPKGGSRMSTSSVTPADGEIISERVFDAPRPTVFGAFADPDRLSRWWGPKGFANTFHEFDLRPGGTWRFVMRGPDGTEYPLTKEFVEVVPGERIVLRQLGGLHQFRMAMSFAAEGGGTRVVWRMRFDSPEEGARVRSFVAAANEENFDRLQAFLAANG